VAIGRPGLRLPGGYNPAGSPDSDEFLFSGFLRLAGGAEPCVTMAGSKTRGFGSPLRYAEIVLDGLFGIGRDSSHERALSGDQLSLFAGRRISCSTELAYHPQDPFI